MKPLSPLTLRRSVVVSLAVGLLAPLVARLPGVPFRGWEWLGDYAGSAEGLVFIAGLNLIPAIALLCLAAVSRRAPVVYWFGVAGLLGFLLRAHGTLNLRSSSTAGIALIFIPFYCVAALLVASGVGWLTQTLTGDDHMRAWLARVAMAVGVGVGLINSATDSASVARRDGRFPVVSLHAIPLVKRQVYSASAIGRVEVLAFDKFDEDADRQVLALGDDGVVLLEPMDYRVTKETTFKHQDCEQCVHMYPYAVPNRNGELLVASSDGLSDSRGRLLWQTKKKGFSRTVPIHQRDGTLSFLAYDQLESITLHAVDGTALWRVNLPAADVIAYVDGDGREWPGAITGYGGDRMMHLYDLTGKEARALKLPDWASNVQPIAWPNAGHLLVGGGSEIGVLGSDGHVVLRHVIEGTSFNPYHGPDGTAVQLETAERPYLAVMSHGSSGYARSVLLVFAPDGRLVWREELNKLRTVLAVPGGMGERDVLLVGGMDGVSEYSMSTGRASQ